ncbi:MAG: hypothetical protein V2I33_25550 [Kangiellaceae bacterium]|jgi:hypothetical protein|nr:hypothetical protein [Kangiellaceae bacterium]
MKSLTRHHIEVLVPELHIAGIEQENLSCEIQIKGDQVLSKYPQETAA